MVGYEDSVKVMNLVPKESKINLSLGGGEISVKRSVGVCIALCPNILD